MAAGPESRLPRHTRGGRLAGRWARENTRSRSNSTAAASCSGATTSRWTNGKPSERSRGGGAARVPRAKLWMDSLGAQHIVDSRAGQAALCGDLQQASRGRSRPRRSCTLFSRRAGCLALVSARSTMALTLKQRKRASLSYYHRKHSTGNLRGRGGCLARSVVAYISATSASTQTPPCLVAVAFT